MVCSAIETNIGMGKRDGKGARIRLRKYAKSFNFRLALIIHDFAGKKRKGALKD
jgi:hypothetical protein